MSKLFCVLGICVLAFAGSVSADSLTFTDSGDCGVSPAVPGVSATSFTWAASNTSASNVSGSVLTSYGFDPLSGAFNGTTPAPYSHNGLYSGSLLLSNPFTVNGSQGITVTFDDLAAMGFDYGNFDFAVLLENGQTAAILGLVSPMTLVGTQDENYLGTFFTPLSAGVQMTTDSYDAAYPQNFELGSTNFGGPAGNRNCDNNPCMGQFTSTYTPDAGTYQLLFGSFSNGNNFADAIAVQSVQVPENNTLGYLALGLLVVAIWYSRRTRLS
jgi:hypothetical protein